MTVQVKRVPNHLLLVVIGILFVIHLVVLVVYTQQRRNSEALEKHDAILQQVMNVVHMVQATPSAQLPQAIKAIDEPNIKVSLSEQPLANSIHLTELTYWRIYHLVPLDSKAISLSLVLGDNRWVNVQAYITINTILPSLFLLLAELLIASIIFFYIWSINRFSRPLKQFKRAAERLGVDIDTQPIQEFYGPSIVRDTARAMNQMQQRIKDLLDDRTLMLAAISHDLRTPITRLKLRMSKLQDEEFVRKSHQDLDEMNTMIGQILAFAKSAKDDESYSRFDLNSLLQAICDEFTDYGSAVYFTANNQRVAFRGRQLALKRAMINLIENALKYGRLARVKLRSGRKNIFIIIDDDGPGIPHAELHKVFSPFYRCDQSRSQKIPGTGLGLAVARDIIRHHHGELHLSNRAEGGLRVKISLPRASNKL